MNITISPKARAVTVHICRLTMGLIFIFSGFVKAVDPWGTALKVNEYLSIYGFEQLGWASMVFSIWLCGAELMMGLMLTFKVRIRLISIFAFASMIFFTILTFLNATWLPVEDCGCFGEAIKLSPWATFAKNAVLLPLSFVVWLYYRPDKIFAFSKLEVGLTVLFFTIGMGVGTYSYFHLPIIDFLPFKVGVNLREARYADEKNAGDEDAVLVYRNVATGDVREFNLAFEDFPNEKEWEWLETRTTNERMVVAPMLSEFVLHDSYGDATDEVLNTDGRLYMLCITDLKSLNSRNVEYMEWFVNRAGKEGATVVCITPDDISATDAAYHSFGNSAPVRCYNVDATLMKTMLRAYNGVIALDDGAIVGKLNCRDIKWLMRGVKWPRE